MKLFFLLLLLFITDLYFFLGTSSLVNKILNNKIIYPLIYWLISSLVYIYLIYIVLNINNNEHDNVSFNILYTSLVFILFSTKFIGSVPLFVDDIFRFFRLVISFFGKNSSYTYDVQRLEFLKKSSLFFSAALFSTLLIGMRWGRYHFKKNYNDILIKNWPANLDNYKIIHISDLHLGSFNSVDKLNEVVDIINNENADLVVFTGDLINNYYFEAIPYIDTLNKIKAKHGKFSILGNHDYGDYRFRNRDSSEWQENFNKLIELEKKAGFDLLLNESRLVSVDGSVFNIVGVENWGVGGFSKDGDLKKAMSNVDDSIPTILLSHDPSHWRYVVQKSNYHIDLQLSGHTHGMQFGIEIPGFKWSPVQYRYREWAGLYEKDEIQIYVNRGLGHLGYAGRVGIMPDISILNIKKRI